jgi:hypothetical protein
MAVGATAGIGRVIAFGACGGYRPNLPDSIENPEADA